MDKWTAGKLHRGDTTLDLRVWEMYRRGLLRGLYLQILQSVQLFPRSSNMTIVFDCVGLQPPLTNPTVSSVAPRSRKTTMFFHCAGLEPPFTNPTPSSVVAWQQKDGNVS